MNRFEEEMNGTMINKMAQKVLKSDKRPEIYKPRKGIPNSGKNQISDENYILTKRYDDILIFRVAGEILRKLNYTKVI